MGIEYEGGFSRTTTNGVGFAGTVANMPIDAVGYKFSWNFFTHKKTIQGAEAFVLEYVTKNVSPAKITETKNANVKIYPNPTTGEL